MQIKWAVFIYLNKMVWDFESGQAKSIEDLEYLIFKGLDNHGIPKRKYSDFMMIWNIIKPTWTVNIQFNKRYTNAKL